MVLGSLVVNDARQMEEGQSCLSPSSDCTSPTLTEKCPNVDLVHDDPPIEEDDEDGRSATNRAGLLTTALSIFSKSQRTTPSRIAPRIRSRKAKPPRYWMYTMPDKISVNEFTRGFPNMAAYVDSSENFMVFRRYGYLSSRLLLEMQDEMRDFEKQLDEMDRRDVSGDPTMLMTRNWDESMSRRRNRLLNEIRKKYSEYGEQDPEP